jgi:bifunctional diaminopimelate decarboxylase / aspartate kinase
MSATRYIVAKFGGTSVATLAGWTTIREVVLAHRAAGRRTILVCSAVAGVTNRLTAAADRVAAGEDPASLLLEIRALHGELGAALEVDAEALLAADERRLGELCRPTEMLAPSVRAEILAQGELMSTRLGAAWLARCGVDAVRLDARTLLRSIGDSKRDERYLSATCAPARGELVSALDKVDAAVIVTQGFIAANDAGETVVLGRGGSDTSGAYFAAASAADALEIWTDVPGMFSADPRHMQEARLLRRMSFREAEAAGALGAKVLHPRAIEPMRHAGIPIRIRWTAHPEIEGTAITRRRSPRGAKVIVSRRDLALVTMWRSSSWQPIGFMARVAARFHTFGLSMDLIASSPSEIRVTIDLAAFPTARADLARLCADLEEVCRPRVISNVSCVSVVGAGISERMLAGWPRFAPIATTAVHLVTHAANGDHVSFVVDPHAEGELVAAAHAELLTRSGDESTFGASWSELVERVKPRKATAKTSGPAGTSIAEMSA